MSELFFQVTKYKYQPRLDSLKFEQIICELKPRIDFLVRRHSGNIPGFEDDDIRQELLIELWEKMDRIPKDISHLDYRFTRYIETVLRRKIIDIHRGLLIRVGYNGPRLQGEYRDAVNRSLFVGEHMEVFEQQTRL